MGKKWLARQRVYLLCCKQVLGSDHGVVTVEWVALAAGLVVGSIVVSLILMEGVAGAANSLANILNAPK
jgi:hypothetical protein